MTPVFCHIGPAQWYENHPPYHYAFATMLDCLQSELWPPSMFGGLLTYCPRPLEQKKKITWLSSVQKYYVICPCSQPVWFLANGNLLFTCCFFNNGTFQGLLASNLALLNNILIAIALTGK